MMWALINAQTAELQALGPLATIFASLVAAGVAVTFGIFQYRLGVAQKEVAASQRDIAYDKLKFDLFAKRYEIYEATFLACRAILFDKFAENAEHIERWSLRLTEASFLFSPNVVELTTKVNEYLGEWRHLNSLDQPNLKELIGDDLRARRTLMLDKLAEVALVLPSTFESELSFQQLTGKLQ